MADSTPPPAGPPKRLRRRKRDKALDTLLVLPRMVRIPRISNRTGLAPGAPVYRGPKKDEPIKLDVICYDAASYSETKDVARDAIPPVPEQGVVWIDVSGVHDPAVVVALGEKFKLHTLQVEDVLNPAARPKAELFEDEGNLELIVKMARPAPPPALVETEQVVILFGRGWVLTFQERPGDVFEHVRQRLRDNRPRIRKRGADYLAYALLDAIVDGYLVCLDSTADVVEAFEDRVVANQDPPNPLEMHALRKELWSFRRVILPTRDAVDAMLVQNKGDGLRLVDKTTRPFLGDLRDHLHTALDHVDLQREGLSASLDLHFALQSHQQNEVSRALTVVATIFLPLSFLAGVYGMNFAHMPELAVPWAYPALLAVMAGLAAGMLVFFRWRRWI